MVTIFITYLLILIIQNFDSWIILKVEVNAHVTVYVSLSVLDKNENLKMLTHKLIVTYLKVYMYIRKMYQQI